MGSFRSHTNRSVWDHTDLIQINLYDQRSAKRRYMASAKIVDPGQPALACGG